MKKAEIIRFTSLVKADLSRHEKGRLSAWAKGVNTYAQEIAQEITENMEHGYITLDDLCNSKLREKSHVKRCGFLDSVFLGRLFPHL